MKRRKSELEFIKSFVDGAYSRLGNVLLVDTDEDYSPEDPSSALGYCFKHTDPVSNSVIYQIKCSKIGIEATDFRIMMHEYGHIYLGHLDGIHEELDSQVISVFDERRGELIDHINKVCGIDFADKLIERVIDDPVLNHSIHNIAMDMEVNSKILSSDDVDEMEMDITSVMPKYQEKALKYLRDNAALDEETKKQLDETIKKAEKESKIKLILPCRYNLSSGDENQPAVPFPDGLTYAEYLILIIEHLDQFVKMLVSINAGGNGDTSEITKEMVQQALQDYMNQQGQGQGKSEEYNQGYKDAIQDYNNGMPGQTQQQVNQQAQQNQGAPGQQGQQGQQGQNTSSDGSGQPQQGSGQGQPGQQGGMTQQQLDDYNQGYQDGMSAAAQNGGSSGMQSLNDLMGDCGMSGNGSSSENNGKEGQTSESGNGGRGGYKGMRSDPTAKDGRMDHRTDSRDQADAKREAGKLHRSGGVGCGDSGGPDCRREVDKNVDPVEMAMAEVIQNVKAKVIKQEVRRDVMKLYNRGIIRSVIAPTVSKKITVTVDPKIVYLIDISGSMDTRLIDRILKSIGKSIRKLNRGLKYDIITWSTCMGEHIKDIDPKKGVPKISSGGGTRLAGGIQYFKDHYGPEAILIVISDFEDYLEEWNKVESTMPEYDLWGFNYGSSGWGTDSDNIPWKNMKIRKFKDR